MCRPPRNWARPARRCSGGQPHAPADAARPALAGRAVDMWTMRSRAPARPVDNAARCPPPVPSPTCPQPSTTVAEPQKPGPATLARLTTDRLASRRRSQGAPGSYLDWKRLCAVTINGLLTPLERRATLDRIRLGDAGNVLVSPEQFRSRTFWTSPRPALAGQSSFSPDSGRPHCRHALLRWPRSLRR